MVRPKTLELSMMLNKLNIFSAFVFETAVIIRHFIKFSLSFLNQDQAFYHLSVSKTQPFEVFIKYDIDFFICAIADGRWIRTDCNVSIILRILIKYLCNCG